ncbi:hypothetical protein, partial [Aliivibrio fischeri]|uniref:hypothetical protein n=1 Tax=Aliivibrio fischeri TaxID=668 RepID=UPI001F528A2A
HRIMAITSAFQADDAGSIPAVRSNLLLLLLRDCSSFKFPILFKIKHFIACFFVSVIFIKPLLICPLHSLFCLLQKKNPTSKSRVLIHLTVLDN